MLTSCCLSHLAIDHASPSGRRENVGVHIVNSKMVAVVNVLLPVVGIPCPDCCTYRRLISKYAI